MVCPSGAGDAPPIVGAPVRFTPASTGHPARFTGIVPSAAIRARSRTGQALPGTRDPAAGKHPMSRSRGAHHISLRRRLVPGSACPSPPESSSSTMSGVGTVGERVPSRWPPHPWMAACSSSGARAPSVEARWLGLSSAVHGSERVAQQRAAPDGPRGASPVKFGLESARAAGDRLRWTHLRRFGA
jgi:hypothetical protein